MPIYEFYCDDCGSESEILVKSSDWEGTQCPHCQSEKLSKKLSTFAARTENGVGIGGGDLPPCSGNPGACGRCEM